MDYDERAALNFPLRKSIEEIIEENQENILSTLHSSPTSLSYEISKASNNNKLNEENSNENPNENALPVVIKPNDELKEYFANNPHLFVTCPSCEFVFEISDEVDGLPSYINPFELTEHQISHYQSNRFRCRICTTEFCSKCKQTPYHLGKICNLPPAPSCRFCKTEKKFNNEEEQLNDKLNDKLEGDEEKNAFVCSYCTSPFFEDICKKSKDLNCILHQSHTGNCISIHSEISSNICSICFTEELSTQPCISMTSCSHVFHYNCFVKQIDSGVYANYTRNRLDFSHCLCSVCKSLMLPAQTPLLRSFQDEKLKYIDLIRRCVYQLRAEKLEIPFGEGEEEFALRKFNFYNCHICQSIYYGGRRECGVDVEGIHSSKFACGGCRNKCKFHDPEYSIYKCRYCCNLATYFCFGTTHFCADCHDNIWGLINAYGILEEGNKIRKCRGKKCPSGGKHPANGEEHFVGCYKCLVEIRSNNDKSKRKIKKVKKFYLLKKGEEEMMEIKQLEMKVEKAKNLQFNGAVDIGFDPKEMNILKSNKSKRNVNNDGIFHIKIDKKEFLPKPVAKKIKVQKEEEAKREALIFYQKKKGNIHICDRNVVYVGRHGEIRSVKGKTICNVIKWNDAYEENFLSFSPQSNSINNICSHCINNLSDAQLITFDEFFQNSIINNNNNNGSKKKNINRNNKRVIRMEKSNADDKKFVLSLLVVQLLKSFLAIFIVVTILLCFSL